MKHRQQQSSGLPMKETTRNDEANEEGREKEEESNRSIDDSWMPSVLVNATTVIMTTNFTNYRNREVSEKKVLAKNNREEEREERKKSF